MARQDVTLPPSIETITTVCRDLNGDVIGEVSASTVLVHNQDEIRRQRQNESIQLATGEQWHPGLRMRVGVCERCRNLVSMQRAIPCADCQQLLCGRHARRGADGKWRCLSHARRFRLLRFLERLFYSIEEE